MSFLMGDSYFETQQDKVQSLLIFTEKNLEKRKNPINNDAVTRQLQLIFVVLWWQTCVDFPLVKYKMEIRRQNGDILQNL